MFKYLLAILQHDHNYLDQHDSIYSDSTKISTHPRYECTFMARNSDIDEAFDLGRLRIELIVSRLN